MKGLTLTQKEQARVETLNRMLEGNEAAVVAVSPPVIKRKVD